MNTEAVSPVIEGTNIVDPRSSAYAVTVSERMGEVTIREWRVKPRDVVQPDTVIALVEDQFGEIEMQAGETGMVAAVMHPVGTTLLPHAVLCYIRVKVQTVPKTPTVPSPPKSGSARRLVEQLRPAPDATTESTLSRATYAEPPEENVIAIEEIVLPARRVNEMPVRDVPIVATPVRLPQKPVTEAKGEPNTVGKKYRLTPHQERLVSDIATKLNRYTPLRDEVRQHKVRDSELVRALIEWFDQQSAELQATIVRENRVKERAGLYGIGWPRPPRAKGAR